MINENTIMRDQYIKKDYFVDFEQMSYSHVQCEIINIVDNKVQMRNVQKQFNRYGTDITSAKLKPFRTFTKPIQNSTFYHNRYSYWGDKFLANLQTLRNINQSSNIADIMSVVEIVQFFKGRNFYSLHSYLDDKRICQNSCSQDLFQYIKEFLIFFDNYIRAFNAAQCEAKKLYHNHVSALMLSHREIMIGLFEIFCRESILQYRKLIQRNLVDSIMEYQLNWLNQKLLPFLKNKQNLGNLVIEIYFKLCQLILRLIKNHRIERNQCILQVLQNLVAMITQKFQFLNYQKFNEYFTMCNDLIGLIDKTKKQFIIFLKCKLLLQTRYLSLLDEYPFTQGSNNLLNRGSQIFNYNEKYQKLIKQMNFVLICCQYEQLQQLVKKYMSHPNGLALFVRNSTISQTNQLAKIGKYFMDQLLREMIKNKKYQLLKQMRPAWTIHRIGVVLQTCLLNLTGVDKDDFATCYQIHRILAQQLQSKVKLLKQQSLNQPNSMVDVSIITQDQKILQQDMVNVCQIFEKLQYKIIKYCQILCDLAQRTISIQYVQTHIIPKFIDKNPQFIYNLLGQKETNVFRQRSIFTGFFLKFSFNQTDQKRREFVIRSFQKLCHTMIQIKQKSLLECRKQLLIMILKKFVAQKKPNYTCQLINLLIIYIKGLKYVQNRQFKYQSLEFVEPLIDKKYIYDSESEKIKYFEQILSAIKVEQSSQFKTFAFFFKCINNYRQTCKLNQQPLFPLIIYERPYGIDGIYQIFNLPFYDKGLIKKVLHFFTKYHLRFADEQLRKQQVSQLLQRIFECLKKYNKPILNKLQLQILNEIFMLVQSLMISHLNIKYSEASTTQSSYSKIFKNSIQQNSIKQPYNNTFEDRQVEINKKQKASSDVNYIQIQITLSNQQTKIQEQKRSIFNIRVEPSQKLFAIKHKATVFYQIWPVLCSLYVGSSKIDHKQQMLTIEQIYSKYKQTNCQKQSAQPNEVQEKPQIKLKLSLRQLQKDTFVKQEIKKRVDIIFAFLPTTRKIWQQLEITPQYWNEHERLKEIKQSFINCQLGQHDESSMSQEELMNRPEIVWWNLIVEESTKKKIILDVLLADQNISQYRVKWGMDLISVMRTKVDISSNMQALKVIDMLNTKISHQSFEKVLQKFKFSQKILQNQGKQVLKSFEIMLNQTFKYINRNAQFDLFKYLMNVKSEFLFSLQHQAKLSIQLGLLFLNSFFIYLRNNSRNFIQFEMLNFLNYNCSNYIFLVESMERINFQFQEKIKQTQLIQLWLQKSVYLLINNFRKQKKNQTKALLNTISCILAKNIKHQVILLPEFKKLLCWYLYSRLSDPAICIITHIVSLYPSQGKSYIQHFQKQMNEPEWDKKDFFRYHKSLRNQFGYLGLRNPHSICYANSLLQQLFHIKEFRYGMFETKWKKNQIKQQDLIYQIKKTFINLQERQSDSYYNADFFKAFKNGEGGSTNVEIQMDVDQFKSILFDRVQNLLINAQNQTLNVVQKVFNGKQITLIKSKQCQHRSQRQELFSSICVQVKGLKQLNNSLQRYFQPQLLNQDNCYLCQLCNKKVEAEKTIKIKQYPKYMTFVLKRFQYVNQYRKKINQRFQFPFYGLILNNNKYNLKGIIVHQGISQAGHYFSFIKINKRWYEFNDNSISQTRQQNICMQAFGQSNTRSTKNAYLLIYEKQLETQRQIKIEQNVSKKPKVYYGIEQQLVNIQRSNQLMWKIQLFLNESFSNFVQTVVKDKIESSNSLLLQHTLNIKAKSKSTLKNLQSIFQLLQQNFSADLLNNQQHLYWCLNFYRNNCIKSSIKAALTSIIIKNYRTFNPYIKKFLQQCINIIHTDVQTSPFYQLFLAFAKKDQQVLKFLVSSKIVARIYQVSVTPVLLSSYRIEVSQNNQIKFPLISQEDLQIKKRNQNHQRRYHKWRLLNFILQSRIQLSRIERSYYIESWVAIKCHMIYQQATTKANINQISKFFCLISASCSNFGEYYLRQVCQQLSNQKSQNLRRYLKAASDLLKINDSHKQNRMRLIKNAFSQTFKLMHKHKYTSSFDLKWQWFIKIGFQNRDFRRLIRQSIDQFKIINNKQDLNYLFQSRNQINSQSKNKNKYYGLKFCPINSTSTYIEQKFSRSRMLFTGDQNEIQFKKISLQYAHYNTDLTDFPELNIQQKTKILKYNQSISKFKQYEIQQILGDLIIIDQVQFDRGDQRLMHCFPVLSQFKQEEVKLEIQ